MVTLHATGDWSEQQVLVETTASSHHIPPEVQRLIDAAWAQAAARPGVHLFDGPMVRWEGWDAAPGRLRLRLSHTSYKAFLGTNMANPHLDRALLANPVGLSAAVTTADGRLLLGRRSARVAYYPGRIHPFAGGLEPRDAGRIFDGIRRELFEELALEPAGLLDLRCIGIAEDHALRQGELLFSAAVALSSEALCARVEQTEHQAAVAVAPDELDDLLADPARLTPVCVAVALLWGRPRRGEAWYRRQLHRFS